MNAGQKEEFDREGDVDFAYEVPGVVRLRCNIYRQKNGIAGCFRLLPTRIMTLQELNLPEHLQEFTDYEKGDRRGHRNNGQREVVHSGSSH